MGAEGRPAKLKLGDRVRFTKMMAGFNVKLGSGRGGPRTKDPIDGLYATWWTAPLDRLREIAPDAKYGDYRVVVKWDVRPRREYDLHNHDIGIIVGKTFRYEGMIHFEDGCMSHVGPIDGGWNFSAKRVECWEVKQALNKRAVLVPLDAVELIDV